MFVYNLNYVIDMGIFVIVFNFNFHYLGQLY